MKKKHYFLMIIVPALIAGLFAFSPKIYEIITKPKKVLNYTIKTGPGIQENGIYEGIILIEIINNGQVVLSNLVGSIQVKNGNIKKIVVDDINAIKPATQLTENSFTISCNKFLPKDSYYVSMLVTSNLKQPEILSSIRTDEIKAIELKDSEKKSDLKFSMIGALLASLSVVLMMTTSFSKTFRNNIGKLVHSQKNDILLYIAIKTNNSLLIRTIQNNADIAYLRVSDLILCNYLRNQCDLLFSAQKSMLLIKDIADISRNIILDNLEKMGMKSLTDDELKNIDKYRTNDLLKIRNSIDKIFSKDLLKF